MLTFASVLGCSLPSTRSASASVFLREGKRLLVFSLAVELADLLAEGGDIVCSSRRAHGSASSEDRKYQGITRTRPSHACTMLCPSSSVMRPEAIIVND